MTMTIEKIILDHNYVDCVYFFTSYDSRNNIKNRNWFHLNDDLSQDDQKKFFDSIKDHKSEIREIIKKKGFKFYQNTQVFMRIQKNYKPNLSRQFLKFSIILNLLDVINS